MSSQKELLTLEGRYPVGGDGFRGKFVVISNETFLNKRLKKRDGTAEDVKRLQDTFSELGFDFTNNIHVDRTGSQMRKIMTEVSNAGLENYDCLAVAILSHGESNGKIHGAGPAEDLIDLDRVLEPLKYGRSSGKPVLIFIQACRGENLDAGKLTQTDTPSNPGSDSDSPSFIKIPVEADFLYHFSTSPGYFSFRNTHGSVFIQTLCKVMAKYIEKKGEIDLVKALTRVNREVAEGYSSYAPSSKYLHNMKQMPSILSMLRMDVYLYPK